jgi:hypothetical protein
VQEWQAAAWRSAAAASPGAGYQQPLLKKQINIWKIYRFLHFMFRIRVRARSFG